MRKESLRSQECSPGGQSLWGSVVGGIAESGDGDLKGVMGRGGVSKRSYDLLPSSNPGAEWLWQFSARQ